MQPVNDAQTNFHIALRDAFAQNWSEGPKPSWTRSEFVPRTPKDGHLKHHPTTTASSVVVHSPRFVLTDFLFPGHTLEHLNALDDQ